MSKKNNGGGFGNLAARKFAGSEIDKIPKMSQYRIYSILDADIDTILSQFAKNRAGVKDAKYPEYVINAFANISTAKWFWKYIKKHAYVETKRKKKNRKKITRIRTDLTFEQIDALRIIIANAYVSSLTNGYPTEAYDAPKRHRFLLDAYKRLDPERIWIARKKLHIKDIDVCARLAMLIYLEPRYQIKKIANIFDKAEATISDKKKMKVLMNLYEMRPEELAIREARDTSLSINKDPCHLGGEFARFAEAIGYAFTTDNTSSDFIPMCIKYVNKQSKSARRAFLTAYADAFKSRKTANFMLKTDDFYARNKKIIKKLVKMDEGYRKAFKVLKLVPKKDKEPKSKRVTK